MEQYILGHVRQFANFRFTNNVATIEISDIANHWESLYTQIRYI